MIIIERALQKVIEKQNRDGMLRRVHLSGASRVAVPSFVARCWTAKRCQGDATDATIAPVDKEMLSIIGGADFAADATASGASDFGLSLSRPLVRPVALPYLLPPRWVGAVAALLVQHFDIRLPGAQAGTEDAVASAAATNAKSFNRTANRPRTSATAKRPELFLQAFVHPSFLRSTADAGSGEDGAAVAGGAGHGKQPFRDRSMDALADIGTAVLTMTSNALASDMKTAPEPGMKSSASATTTATSSSITLCVGDTDPEVSTSLQEQKNNSRLLSAACEDHALSLVCFNVWRTADLVLTDAGIFGLRDALRSTRERIRVPPLTMPAAAASVRAVVGAVYLNFGLEAAVEFCQVHVLAHAVEFVSL